MLNSNKTIRKDEITYQTKQADVLLVECCDWTCFAIDAIAAGKQAAISIHRFFIRTDLLIGVT